MAEIKITRVDGCVTKSANIHNGAKVTYKSLTLEEYNKYYSNIKASGYNPPAYQRPTILTYANGFFLSLLSYVLQFDEGYEPSVDFIFIREIEDDAGNITIEIIDGQHRSEMIQMILDGEATVATSDYGRELNKIAGVYGGLTFDKLPTKIQRRIKNLTVPVQFVVCDEEVATVLFQILNSGSPLKPKDKIRNNWYKNNLYVAVESACETANTSRYTKTANGFRNMLYRCVAHYANIESSIAGLSAKDANNVILENTTSWNKDKCFEVINDITSMLDTVVSILPGRNPHEIMALYKFIRDSKDSKTKVKNMMKSKRHFNDKGVVVNMSFATQFVLARQAAVNSGKVVLRDDTYHNQKYTDAYTPVIASAYNTHVAKSVKRTAKGV